MLRSENEKSRRRKLGAGIFFAVAGEGRRLFAGDGGLQREGMPNPAGGMARRDGPEPGAEKGPHRSRNADAESRRRRRDAGGGEVGQETEWRAGIRSGGRGGLKGTGGGFGWKRRRIREKAA